MRVEPISPSAKSSNKDKQKRGKNENLIYKLKMLKIRLNRQEKIAKEAEPDKGKSVDRYI